MRNTANPLQDSLLQTEQVQLLYGGLPLALFFNVVLSALLANVMWPAVSPSMVISWLALVGLVLAWRAGIFVLHRNVGAGKSAVMWLKHFRASVVATGLVWGLASWLLFPKEDIPHQVFVAFVLAGVSSAAITSLASDRVSALGFIAPALLPLVFNFVLEGGAMPLSMGLMVALFLVFLAAASARMQQNLQENVRLRAASIEQHQAMLESEQRFRYIIDTCPTAARIARAGGHEVIFSNPSYATLINATPEQVSGVDPTMYYANPQDYKDILLQLKKGEQVLERLVELNIKGVGTKWALASYLQIQYQGEPATLGWFHDITERIRIERMKTEFVSTVSHELRTPLTAISGALGLLAGGVLGTLPAQIKDMVVIAHKNSERLTFLINDLLDMEKLVEGKLDFNMQIHSLRSLLEQALEANRPYGAKRHVSLQLTGNGHGAYVYLDSQRFMQVLSNLLSNAIKYSPDKGTVKTDVSLQDNMVRVTVTDNGPGISEEFRTRIFQKFAQADSSDTRQKGGTGLGLAITKQLVENMGGRIGFDSIAGEGASFYVEFPLIRKEA